MAFFSPMQLSSCAKQFSYAEGPTLQTMLLRYIKIYCLEGRTLYSSARLRSLLLSWWALGCTWLSRTGGHNRNILGFHA